MIVNKCLRQNWKVFNNIKMFPLGEVEEESPKTKKEAAFWAEKIWTHLCEDEVERILCFARKAKGTNKYTITVWKDDEYVYLVAVVRTEYNTDSTSVYIQKYSEDNLSDFKVLAKFIHREINNITGHSINGFKELNKLTAEYEAHKIEEEMKGNA